MPRQGLKHARAQGVSKSVQCPSVAYLSATAELEIEFAEPLVQAPVGAESGDDARTIFRAPTLFPEILARRTASEATLPVIPSALRRPRIFCGSTARQARFQPRVRHAPTLSAVPCRIEAEIRLCYRYSGSSVYGDPS